MLFRSVSLFTKNVQDANYYDKNLVILFSLVGLLNMIRVPHNSIIEASGHYEQTKYRALLEAIINFVVSILLVNFIGIYGVLLGAVASFCYRTIDIIVYTDTKIFKRSVIKDLLLVCSYFSVSLFVISVMVPITNNFEINNWFMWIVFSIISSLVSLVIYVIFTKILYSEIYILIKKRLINLIKR